MYKHMIHQAWAIGDVHGCSKEFRTICEEIYRNQSNAEIFQLGDLIDRGPDLLEVFEVVEDFGVNVILGNHEINFMLEVIGYKECRSKERQLNIEKFKSYKKKDQKRIMDILTSSYNYVIIPNEDNESGFVLSHSIFKKGNNSNGWTNSSTNHLDEVPKNRDDNLVCVHGHMAWAYDDVMNHLDDQNINIDSGLCYGRYLTAIKLSSKEVIKVNALKTYFEQK